MAEANREMDLLEGARQLMGRTDAATAGLWPRASALLGRQALEAALDRYWAAQSLLLEECSMRAKLICLRERHADPALAARVAHAWQALSRACHHHPYELPPTVRELEGWLSTVEEFQRQTLGGAKDAGGEPRP